MRLLNCSLDFLIIEDYSRTKVRKKNKNQDFAPQRREMVEDQIRSRGIKDLRIIEAFLKIPRQIFVPERDRSLSYRDGPLPIGFGQTISQPYIVAYMTDILELTGEERVLEIGTGCGYQTAVLAEIVFHVYSLEIIEDLLECAQKILNGKMNYQNISFKCGNGREGWQEHAPFDRILLTAAPETFPDKLFSQLNEGGIAVAPIGGFAQKMVKFRKIGGKIEEESLIGVSFVPFV